MKVFVMLKSLKNVENAFKIQNVFKMRRTLLESVKREERGEKGPSKAVVEQKGAPVELME